MKKLVSITILILFVIPNMLLAAERVSLGFLYNSSDSINLVRRTNGSINEVAPTYFDLNNKGNLVVSGELSQKFIEAMKEDGVKVTPFLSNHWNRNQGRAALANKEKLVDQIVEAIEKHDFDGINVDIENLTSSDRDCFTEFVRLLREKMPMEKALTVSVAANPYASDSGWQGSYDYKALGELVDYLFVMTYDEHSIGGAVGPVASGDFVELSIQYALQYVDKSKIVIGIPLYGRFWREGADYGGEAVVIGDMPRIISKFKANVEYDEKAQTPKATFYVPVESTVKVNGTVLEEGNYTFWYENEESIKYKLELVNKYNLKGAGVWALGQEKVDVWKYYKEKLNEAFEEEDIVDIRELYEMFQSASIEMKVSINMEKPDLSWNAKTTISEEISTTLMNIPQKKMGDVKYDKKSENMLKNTNRIQRRVINTSKNNIRRRHLINPDNDGK